MAVGPLVGFCSPAFRRSGMVPVTDAGEDCGGRGQASLPECGLDDEPGE